MEHKTIHISYPYLQIGYQRISMYSILTTIISTYAY